MNLNRTQIFIGAIALIAVLGLIIGIVVMTTGSSKKDNKGKRNSSGEIKGEDETGQSSGPGNTPTVGNSNVNRTQSNNTKRGFQNSGSNSNTGSQNSGHSIRGGSQNSGHSITRGSQNPGSNTNGESTGTGSIKSSRFYTPGSQNEGRSISNGDSNSERKNEAYTSTHDNPYLTSTTELPEIVYYEKPFTDKRKRSNSGYSSIPTGHHTNTQTGSEQSSASSTPTGPAKSQSHSEFNLNRIERQPAVSNTPVASRSESTGHTSHVSELSIRRSDSSGSALPLDAQSYPARESRSPFPVYLSTAQPNPEQSPNFIEESIPSPVSSQLPLNINSTGSEEPMGSSTYPARVPFSSGTDRLSSHELAEFTSDLNSERPESPVLSSSPQITDPSEPSEPLTSTTPVEAPAEEFESQGSIESSDPVYLTQPQEPIGDSDVASSEPNDISIPNTPEVSNVPTGENIAEMSENSSEKITPASLVNSYPPRNKKIFHSLLPAITEEELPSEVNLFADLIAYESQVMEFDPIDDSGFLEETLKMEQMRAVVNERNGDHNIVDKYPDNDFIERYKASLYKVQAYVSTKQEEFYNRAVRLRTSERDHLLQSIQSILDSNGAGYDALSEEAKALIDDALYSNNIAFPEDPKDLPETLIFNNMTAKLTIMNGLEKWHHMNTILYDLIFDGRFQNTDIEQRREAYDELYVLGLYSPEFNDADAKSVAGFVNFAHPLQGKEYKILEEPHLVDLLEYYEILKTEKSLFEREGNGDQFYITKEMFQHLPSIKASCRNVLCHVVYEMKQEMILEQDTDLGCIIRTKEEQEALYVEVAKDKALQSLPKPKILLKDALISLPAEFRHSYIVAKLESKIKIADPAVLESYHTAMNERKAIERARNVEVQKIIDSITAKKQPTPEELEDLEQANEVLAATTKILAMIKADNMTLKSLLRTITDLADSCDKFKGTLPEFTNLLKKLTDLHNHFEHLYIIIGWLNKQDDLSELSNMMKSAVNFVLTESSSVAMENDEFAFPPTASESI